MLKIKKVSDIVGLKVFTDAGDYFGEIEEANIIDNKIDGWRIKLSRGSNLLDSLKGARGLIVPHQFVKAIGEIVLVNKGVMPERELEQQEATVEENVNVE